MDLGILKSLGQVAGIGGLALGVLFLTFRTLLRQKLFPKLPAAQASRLLNRLIGVTGVVAIAGIAAWAWIETPPPPPPPAVTAIGGIGVGGTLTVKGNVTLAAPPPTGGASSGADAGVRTEGGIAVGRDMTVGGTLSAGPAAPARP